MSGESLLGLDILNFLIPALIGGGVSLLGTYFANVRVARGFNEALTDLARHIEASLKSLDEVHPDQPKYFIAARVRYCRFLEDVQDIRSGWWVRGGLRRSHRKLLLAIRNSDIFIEEAASRLDGMNDEEIRQCLKEVKVNLDFLKKAVQEFRQE